MTTVEPWEALKEAIVERACIDYRGALNVLKRHPRSGEAKQMISDCESFFIMALTELDGKLLMQRIKEAVGE